MTRRTRSWAASSTRPRAYFKAPRERPTIPEIISLYREQQIAFCLFTVDCESSMGAKRVSNYEIAELRGQERRHRHPLRLDRSAQGQDAARARRAT